MKLGSLGTEGGARTRRNTVTRDDLLPMAAVAAVGAVLAALSGCEPTGNAVGDAVCTGGLAAFTIWMAANASWWSLTLAGTLASVGAVGSLTGMVLGAAGAAVGLWLGDRRASLPAWRCASAVLTVLALLRLTVNPFFGASTVLASGVMLFLIGVGLQRRRRHLRRRIVKYTLVGLGMVVVAVVALALSALNGRDRIETGYRGLLDGLDQLQAGDATAAAATLHRTADALADAADSLDAPWVQPSRLVPIAAQHQQAGSQLMGQAAESAEAAADALDLIDFDALSIEGGRIDVGALAVLAEPLARLQVAVEGLSQALDDADSPWLVGALTDRLATYRDRADDTARQAATISAVARTGPALLGADEPRRYFVGFASPAEGRGLVGVMGNYAIITITDGVIEQTEFGRINELSNRPTVTPYNLQMTDEFHARYGRYGGGDFAGDPASRAFWSNVTMSPDMPTVGTVIEQLWTHVGGEPLDGVIILDPAALAGLLQATGPVVVPGLEPPMSAQNVEQFLLLDQYALDTPERSDMLEAVATATLDAVLSGSLPGPQDLAEALAPAASEGHLLMWAVRADEQALLELVGIDGALPRLEGHDGLAVVTNNAIANKIDSFLERSVTYEAQYDAVTGAVTGTVTIALTNTAPATGLPSYVIGSEFLALPLGTNRTLLSVYSPLQQRAATLDGEPVGLSRDTELGWNVFTLQLDLAPGETRTIVLQLDGFVNGGGYELVLRPQPMATDDRVSLQVVGDADVELTTTLTKRLVVTPTGASTLR